MLFQNFRASAQSALISAIMAVSAFALVIGPDAVRYAAVAALLVLLPVALLAIRMGTMEAPKADPASLQRLELAAAPRVDQILIASAWLGLAGAFVTGLAALDRFAVPGLAWRLAGIAGAGLTTLGATPVIAALIRPWPVAEIGPAGLRLSPTRFIRWRDMQGAGLRTLGPNRLAITLRPSPRDPGGPPQQVRVRLAPVMEPWVRGAAVAMIARNLKASEPARLGQAIDKPKARRRQRTVHRIEDKRFEKVGG